MNELQTVINGNRTSDFQKTKNINYYIIFQYSELIWISCCGELTYYHNVSRAQLWLAIEHSSADDRIYFFHYTFYAAPSIYIIGGKIQDYFKLKLQTITYATARRPTIWTNIMNDNFYCMTFYRNN